MTRDRRHIRVGEVPTRYYYEIVASSQDLASEGVVNLEVESLVCLIIVNMLDCVVEVDVLPELEVGHISLDVAVELYHGIEGVFGGLRREVHEGHGLDWIIGSELLVGGIREISEEAEEVVGSRAVRLSVGGRNSTGLLPHPETQISQ